MQCLNDQQADNEQMGCCSLINKESIVSFELELLHVIVFLGMMKPFHSKICRIMVVRKTWPASSQVAMCLYLHRLFRLSVTRMLKQPRNMFCSATSVRKSYLV